MSGHSFFLKTICGNIQNRLTKEQIYSFYHQRIADKQEKDFRALAHVFKLIDDNIRDLNVDTEDEIEKQIIQRQTQLLVKLDKSIRDAKFSEDAKFLDAIRTVFEYRQVE